MIENEAQYHQTRQQLELMNRSLEELREQVLPKNPQLFAVMAEGPLDFGRQFQHDLAAYDATRDQ